MVSGLADPRVLGVAQSRTGEGVPSPRPPPASWAGDGEGGIRGAGKASPGKTTCMEEGQEDREGRRAPPREATSALCTSTRWQRPRLHPELNPPHCEPGLPPSQTVRNAGTKNLAEVATWFGDEGANGPGGENRQKQRQLRASPGTGPPQSPRGKPPRDTQIQDSCLRNWE